MGAAGVCCPPLHLPDLGFLTKQPILDWGEALLCCGTQPGCLSLASLSARHDLLLSVWVLEVLGQFHGWPEVDTDAVVCLFGQVLVEDVQCLLDQAHTAQSGLEDQGGLVHGSRCRTP